MKPAGRIETIEELPPIWEPWRMENMLGMSKEDTDRLLALLKNKMEVINDVYEFQLFYKQRVEARKDKQIMGKFTDGR
jgi:hypothetical protein